MFYFSHERVRIYVFVCPKRNEYDKSFNFIDTSKAYEYLETQRVKGKIIVQIN